MIKTLAKYIPTPIVFHADFTKGTISFQDELDYNELPYIELYMYFFQGGPIKAVDFVRDPAAPFGGMRKQKIYWIESDEVLDANPNFVFYWSEVRENFLRPDVKKEKYVVVKKPNWLEFDTKEEADEHWAIHGGRVFCPANDKKAYETQEDLTFLGC